MRLRPAVLLAVIAGCTPSGFSAYVINQNRRPIVDAYASLFDGLTSDVCVAQPIAVGVTEADGIATGRARWCGDARLIVYAHGYRSVTRELDTCDSDADIPVELKERPADPPDQDEMVKTARLFIARAAGKPLSLEVPLWVKSGEPTPKGGLDPGFGACDLFFTRSQAGEDPSADFEFQCQGGCTSFWRVRMALAEDGWRVGELLPITSDGRVR